MGKRSSILAEAWRIEVELKGQRPRIVAFLSFFLMFFAIRAVTYSIKYNLVPFFHNVVTPGGVHIHHLVWGILILIVVGYTAVEIATSSWRTKLAIVWGIGAALTLDEFTLWFYLTDNYWDPNVGRESIDVVLIAALLLLLLVVTARFWVRAARLAAARRRPASEAARSNNAT
jgi:hypothetical protein